MSIEPPPACDRKNAQSTLTNRTELDDILDEILAHEIFLQDSRSPDQESKDTSPSEDQNGVRSNNLQAYDETNPSNGWNFRENPVYERTPLADQKDGLGARYVTSSATVGGVDGFPGWIESNGMASWGKPRAPSLPVNWYGEEQRRRFLSVPCNDYYSYYRDQTVPSGGSRTHHRQSDRFVRQLCSSEEPITWLDRQKSKLESINERRRLLHESNQRRQLMEELKSAQRAYAERRRARYPDDYPDELDSPSHVSPPPGRPVFERGASLRSSERRLPGFKSPYLGLRGDELFKSEKNYYVSGIERPPFTTHQTKYVFKVSSPHAAPTRPNDPRPGPPTPKRVSSRGAIRHSLVHDWAIDKWEQESYTSLSSKSDAPERSAFPTADARDVPGLWNTDHTRPTVHPPSSARYSDVRSGNFGSLDNPITHAHGSINGMGFDGTFTDVCPSSAAVDRGALDFGVISETFLNGNGTSSTSSLSIDSVPPRSAFEPVVQSAESNELRKRRHNSNNNTSSTTTTPHTPQKPEPVLVSFSTSISVAPKKTPPSHPPPPPPLPLAHSSSSPPTAVRQSFSLGQSCDAEKPPSIITNCVQSQIRRCVEVDGETNRKLSPAASSSYLPPDATLPPPTSPDPSPRQSQSLLPRGSTSVRPLEQSLDMRRNDDIHHSQTVNTTRTQHLATIIEQPSGNDGPEVLSLQLIGSGMRNLEPDGDLPAVRPVTPKFPHPGLSTNASNSSKPQRRPIENQRSSVVENSLPLENIQKSTCESSKDPLATCNWQPVGADSGEERENCSYERRPHSAEMLGNDTQTTKQRMKHRRYINAGDGDLLRTNDESDEIRRSTKGHQNSRPDALAAAAFSRIERLLCPDFTAQGFGGCGDGGSSPGDRPRRSAGLQPSSPGHSTVEAKRRPDRRRDSEVRKRKQKGLNLSVLDNAVTRLQASVNTPPGESSSSNTAVQSPDDGKTTSRLNAGNDGPKASIRKQSMEAPTTSNSNAETATKSFQAPRFVRDSSKFWHKPHISRDEAIACLQDKPAGTFVVRSSNSFPGAFGLAIKVAQLPPNVVSRGGDPKTELVRHFLIEQTSKGVKLKGCSNEPVFTSLAALVYQHSITSMSLPCKLILPDPSNSKIQDNEAANSDVTTTEVLSLGAACNVLFVNSVDTECLTGNEAVDKAVTVTLAMTPTPMTTVVHFKVSSQGVTLTDTNRKLFFRRHYPFDAVNYAGIDPELREWTWIDEDTTSEIKSKMFGFVARKQGVRVVNSCHVFAELDSDQPAHAIVEFIMKVMLGRGRLKKNS